MKATAKRFPSRILLCLGLLLLVLPLFYCGGGGAASLPSASSPSPSPPPVAIAASADRTLHNLQASSGWVGYGEFPPVYNICSNCGPGVAWSMGQQIKSPSLSGSSTQFNIGGTSPYSDVLWTNPLIGQNSTQGLPDSDHTLIPSLHNFTYDVYFYSDNLAVSQVLEFDINQYFNGMGLTWGNQCRIINGQMWDVWDNVNNRWVPTGIPCNPLSGSWNHLVIQVQRGSDDSLLYKSIALNGVTADIDQSYPRGSAPGGWWGITANFQMDGNSQQIPYSVLLDNFNFSYY